MGTSLSSDVGEADSHCGGICLLKESKRNGSSIILKTAAKANAEKLRRSELLV
jgi:hypothetical protein